MAMEITARIIDEKPPEPKLTLADLGNAVLATVCYLNKGSHLIRYRDGNDVLGPLGLRTGPIVIQGADPENYTVVRVHGLIRFNFVERGEDA